jgi:hypothetical protein
VTAASASKRARLSDESDRGTSEQHDGEVPQRPSEIPHGVRLARAGRAMQQDAALEMAALTHKPLAVACHADYLSLDPVENASRQDNVLAAQLRAAMETNRADSGLELARFKGQHLPTQHVANGPFGAKLGEPSSCIVDISRQHFDQRCHRMSRASATEKHGKLATPVIDEVQPVPHTGTLLLDGHRNSRVVDGANPERSVPVPDFE